MPTPAPLTLPLGQVVPPVGAGQVGAGQVGAPAQPSSPRISGLSWLLIGGGTLAVLAVIGFVIFGLLVTGSLGPVTSSDGRMSVKVPTGWGLGHAASSGAGKPVLVLAGLKKTNGVEPHFIVADSNQFFSLSDLEAGWTRYARAASSRLLATSV